MNLTENKEIILPYEKVEEHYIEDLGKLPKKPFYSFVKRSFDLIVSLLGILIFLIPMLIVAATIKLTSEGPVFFRQERLGKKFNVIKFRTMVADAEKNGAQWCSGNDDERITKTGKFLRKYHIDEIPQLWCIFSGNMSFVGPRPERECFYNEFETYIHGFSERLKVTPGLTGLAQIYGHATMKPEIKIVYDIKYIKTRSLWLDFKILFQTLHYIVRK